MSWIDPLDRRTRMLVLVVVAMLVLLSRLGDGHLANYDDCYYAEKAKEMVQGGDWMTPHFAGVARLDNPPLFLWIVALGFKLFGIGDYGACVFTALAGVGCVLLLVRIARRLGFAERESWAAGVVLLTTQYFLKYAQHAMMDVILTLFFLLGLDGYLSGQAGRRRGFVQLGIATGVGILMKSVLGLFPLLVAAAHGLSVRRMKSVTEPGLWIAGLSTLVVIAPWFGYQYIVHPDLLIGEHLHWLLWSKGVAMQPEAGKSVDVFEYVKRIGSLYWPWLPFAIAGIALETSRARDRSRDHSERSAAILMLVWLIVILVPMSLAHSKKLWYVMSVFPCLGLLSARAIGRALRTETAWRRASSWTLSLLVAFAAVVALTPIGTAHPRDPGMYQIAHIARTTVPAGMKVANLDAFYWDVANQFLFYSDHDVTEPLGLAPLRDELRRGGFALVAESRIAEVLGEGTSDYAVVARSGSWALLTKAPAPPVVVPISDR